LATPYREIIEDLLSTSNVSRIDLDRLKIKISKKYGLPHIPRNSEIISHLKNEEYELLLPILRRKESRALSGVSVVAVMTKPYPCPHGRCAYCPGGPETDSPQSYTGFEPAAMRGSQNLYDPEAQVKSRITQLQSIGHIVDKIDLIIMGGTFPASPRGYQEWFVKGCLDVINNKTSISLADAKQNAEESKIKNVGITVETRPDCLRATEIDEMLDLGVTRVELGVQTIYDDIYQKVDRGHNVDDVVNATARMKDSALKICYHMMPGLPGMTKKQDIEAFKTIFTDPRFKPDMLKIYPTLVVKGTKLYNWWKSGDYEPLTTEAAVEIVAEVKRMVPPWIRIMRVQRDIPLPQIDAGVDKSNLRQLAVKSLEATGERCRCIRCREVGHIKAGADSIRIEINHTIYEASEGTEVFIVAEDLKTDALVGFIRLRIPGQHSHRPEINLNSGLIRELHVYGRMVPVGQPSRDDWQHRGWGETLLNEAEKIAREKYDIKKMVIMSALGTKQYYRNHGYNKDGVYVSKLLR
jgi:elongator complex protein 3